MARGKAAGYRTGDYSLPPELTSYVVCELHYESQIAPTPEGVLKATAATEPQRDVLHQLLSHFAVKRVKPHFPVKPTAVQERLFATAAAPAALGLEFALAGYVRVELENPKQAQRLADKLNDSPAVWKAYVAPRPEPAGKKRPARKRPRKAAPAEEEWPVGKAKGSRNFEPAQGYLDSAPDGTGAAAAWAQGATGKGVTVCDIEGAWQLGHEDLPANVPLLGGAMLNDLGWRNHGTAVLGEMVSRPKNIGCVGLAYQAKPAVQSAVIDGVFNAAGAVVNAAGKLKAGDVILIELHAPGGPDNKYVAMQHWPDVFAAIQAAVAKGVVVVEAGGNGDENFDRPEYVNDGLQKDAGAVVAGAGVPPTNYFDAHAFPGFAPYGRIGAPRSRIWFSNYGQIVNVQGWGWHVATLGYGDAQGGADEKAWYTLRFSGTSSASPIVTAAAACLQSYAKARLGSPLTPARLRDILMNTGTPQADDAPRAPLIQKIGPQPDLERALQAVDALA
jgi:subtilisin family serine protease